MLFDYVDIHLQFLGLKGLEAAAVSAPGGLELFTFNPRPQQRKTTSEGGPDQRRQNTQRRPYKPWPGYKGGRKNNRKQTDSDQKVILFMIFVISILCSNRQLAMTVTVGYPAAAAITMPDETARHPKQATQKWPLVNNDDECIFICNGVTIVLYILNFLSLPMQLASKKEAHSPCFCVNWVSLKISKV